MKSFKQYLKENEMTPERGTQYGSNEGGIHTDAYGVKHYVKYYKNPDQGKVEALTGKIYDHMGIRTLSPQHTMVNGRPAVVTAWNTDIKPMKSHDFDHPTPSDAHQLAKMYHAAILTKNWDIVGLEHDNIARHKDGSLVAVDHGGAFHFRAQGGRKDYGPDIGEKKSLRHNDGASGHVFSTALSLHPEAEQKSLDDLKNLDDNHVYKLFQDSGLSNWQDLHKNFMERKSALMRG